MLLQTILNQVQPCKSFCYESACFEDGGRRIVVGMRARKNGRPICSGCGAKCPGYDRLKERRYEFVPLWNIPVFLSYRPRRVQCSRCGVKVEEVPWAQGKSQHCTVYEWFLAAWAKLLAWQQVARSFGTSWNTVHRAVQAAVLWGLERRSLDGIGAIGVDEIAWQKGHHYLTLVYQIDAGQKRLLHVSEGRTKESLKTFFKETLGQERSEQLRFACSDMWGPYLDVIDRWSMAVNILDRFHIMKKMNEAIDKIRRQEMSKARQAGYQSVLKNSRWCLLKRRENLTKKQVVKLRELLQYNLPPVKAHLLREDFQRFWKYKTKKWARRFLEEWCARVMKTNLEPLKDVARMLLKHEWLLLNWFEAKGELSCGSVEGMNYKVKLAMKKAYGYRSLDVAKTVLYHQLGRLPEREFAHRFW
jgi:transposase